MRKCELYFSLRTLSESRSWFYTLTFYTLADLEAPGLRALGLRAPGCNGTVRAVARHGTARRRGAETDNKALQANFEL